MAAALLFVPLDRGLPRTSLLLRRAGVACAHCFSASSGIGVNALSSPPTSRSARAAAMVFPSTVHSGSFYSELHKTPVASSMCSIVLGLSLLVQFAGAVRSGTSSLTGQFRRSSAIAVSLGPSLHLYRGRRTGIATMNIVLTEENAAAVLEDCQATLATVFGGNPASEVRA